MKFYTTSKISENIRETPEGFLVCLGVPIARTGEMIYGHGETPLEVGSDGRIVIDREADEVFRAETIASFEGKAVTVTHPEEFVDPSNWKQLACGVLQNVRRGDGDQKTDLIADLLITDKVAIDLVKSGLREVSCGYEAEYVQTGPGRGLQKQIVGNHLALVDEGRAGSSYAINDHKGKGSTAMKLKDKIKSIFGKAQDEALALVTDAESEPAEKKEKKAEDEGAMSYDKVMAAIKDMGAKIDAISGVKGKDATKAASESSPAETVAEDEGEEEAPSLEARLAKLEQAVAKLLESKSAAADEDADAEEGAEMVGDEDADAEEAEETGDTADTSDAASRIEILAPGLKATGKDAKVKALKAAYATKDGKAIIHQFTDGKAPDLKNEAKVNTLFIAASELLKVSRASELSKTKTRDFNSSLGVPSGAMTPEKINEINSKHYNSKH